MMNVLNDEYFMRQALAEARIAADEGEVPVGAVIVCNNQIIARAHNQTACVMCAGALGWSQISQVIYGAADEKRGFQRYAPKALHPKTIVKQGIMEEDCAEIMRQFFRQKR